MDAIKLTTVSWPSAYRAFLLDDKESLVLKLAPIALLLGTPEVIASNLIPVVGELVDVGGLTLTALVLFRTYLAVRRHRQIA